ncbi:MAG: hypothetical protein WAW92_04130, partial [Minisyncoccia bacterium]
MQGSINKKYLYILLPIILIITTYFLLDKKTEQATVPVEDNLASSTEQSKDDFLSLENNGYTIKKISETIIPKVEYPDIN